MDNQVRTKMGDDMKLGVRRTSRLSSNDLGFRVQGLGFRSLGFRSLGFRV